MTLYLKYRPQTIDELDLASVRSQIKKLSNSLDDMPHAFLFSGPRGAGKTSAARILAKLVNCENPNKTNDWLEPCNKCDNCRAITEGQSMDVVELDTASNRGIDDIRALRENIALSPARAKKKVYIMDEAHMLTVEAANAFLKTLEEPPDHAIFILATTDPHKLPETVRSRLTLVPFTKATEEEISRQLSKVIKEEKLDVEKGVIELIAQKVDGSFREAVKILEALSLEKEITKKVALEYLYSSNVLDASDLSALIYENKTEEALGEVKKFADSGGSVKDLIDDLQEVFREKMLANIMSGDSADYEIKILKHIMDARQNLGRSALSELPLEIAIIECTEQKRENGEKAPPEPLQKEDVKLAPVAPKKKVVGSATQIDASLWSEVLQKTRVKNTALEAVLRTAKPIGIDGNTINLVVYYQFHKERLEVEQYRRTIESIVEEVMGISPAKIMCQIEEAPAEMQSEPEVPSLTAAPAKDIMQAAKEIFGE